MKIVLTGGGTGGHLFPLVSVAEKIREKDPNAKIQFLGPGGKIEKETMEKYSIPTRSIMSGKWRRYFSFANFSDFFRIFFGFFQALFWLFIYMPDVVFGKGGFASIPVVLAAWVLRIPILIHESDSRPGIANTILGKFADRIAISYARAKEYFLASKVVLTGNPLRKSVVQGDPQKAREKFSLTESKKNIVVLGGSQGAQIINNKILEILPSLLHRYEVIHQTGERNYKEVLKKAGEMGVKAGREGYHPIPFLEEGYYDLISAADLVISRAGANSISDIAANKKPAILIPIEKSANNHQRMNAYSLAEAGGAIVLEESNLGENLLLKNINGIMEDEELRNKLSQNIAGFYHPDAAEKITQGIMEIMK